MNPHKLFRFAQQILALPEREADDDLLRCAKITKLCLMSMLTFSVTTLATFVYGIYGPWKLWEKAILWHENGIPLFTNIPWLMLAVSVAMFLLVTYLLFTQHTTHHGRTVMQAKMLADGVRPQD